VRTGFDELVQLVTTSTGAGRPSATRLTLRGERGEQARATENFCRSALRERLDVPVLLFDERLDADLAEQNPSSAPETRAPRAPSVQLSRVVERRPA